MTNDQTTTYWDFKTVLAVAVVLLRKTEENRVAWVSDEPLSCFVYHGDLYMDIKVSETDGRKRFAFEICRRNEDLGQITIEDPPEPDNPMSHVLRNLFRVAMLSTTSLGSAIVELEHAAFIGERAKAVES